MNRKIFALFGVLSLFGIANAADVNSSKAALEAAIENPSLNNLKGTWQTVIAMSEDQNSKNWNLEKKAKLEALLDFILLLQRQFHPKILKGEPPVLNVSVPGVQPGASASSVKDPETRAKYEKAIADNTKLSEEYNLQYGIQRLLERSKSYTKKFIKRSFSADEITQLDKSFSDSEKLPLFQALIAS